jgi:hypothetical protein
MSTEFIAKQEMHHTNGLQSRSDFPWNLCLIKMYSLFVKMKLKFLK